MERGEGSDHVQTSVAHAQNNSADTVPRDDASSELIQKFQGGQSPSPNPLRLKPVPTEGGEVKVLDASLAHPPKVEIPVVREHVQINNNFKLYCVVRPFNHMIDHGSE